MVYRRAQVHLGTVSENTVNEGYKRKPDFEMIDMVEKKNQVKTDEKKINTSKSPRTLYNMNEVFKITDDLFTLSKEREYPMGAFVHGLIFALEFAQQTYQIPHQQIAEIKRDCRRYVDEIVRSNALKNPSEPKKK